METKPNIFIVESLKFKDETEKRFEGKILSDILRLSGKDTKYYYIRTKKEFLKVLKIFQESKFRYLHLSCHANENSIAMTLDKISFTELRKIIMPVLIKKRIFVSACSAINNDFKNIVLSKSQCLSAIGPDKKINFDDAAIVWATFYHLCFKENMSIIEGSTIDKILSKIAMIFGIRLNGYSKQKNGEYRHLKMDNIRLQEISDSLNAFI
jgi:hypothetical protein